LLRQCPVGLLGYSFQAKSVKFVQILFSFICFLLLAGVTLFAQTGSTEFDNKHMMQHCGCQIQGPGGQYLSAAIRISALGREL